MLNKIFTETTDDEQGVIGLPDEDITVKITHNSTHTHIHNVL